MAPRACSVLDAAFTGASTRWRLSFRAPRLSQGRGGRAGRDRRVEQLDGMHDVGQSTPSSARPARSCIVQPGLALAITDAPVARTASAFSRCSRSGELGLGHVVETGGAAAPVAVGDLDDLQARDRAAAAPAAARGCPGRAGRGTRRGRRRARCRSHPSGTSPSPSSNRNAITSRTGRSAPVDELGVRAHVRAAARRVHDDVVDAGEGPRVAAGEAAGGVEPSVVRLQRSAAALGPGHRDPPPGAGEHADRREVHLVEPAILHAARRARDRAARPRRPRAARSRGGSRANGDACRGIDRPDAPGHERPGHRLERGDEPDQRRPRKHDVEPDPSDAGARPRQRRGSISVRARSIMRPNGTCDGQTSSHARQTRQRSMNEANVSSTSAMPSATARIAAIRPRGDADLLAGQPVRRTVRQAQPARDAGVEVDVGRMIGAEPVRRRRRPRARRIEHRRAARCRARIGVGRLDLRSMRHPHTPACTCRRV